MLFLYNISLNVNFLKENTSKVSRFSESYNVHIHYIICVIDSFSLEYHQPSQTTISFIKICLRLY